MTTIYMEIATWPKDISGNPALKSTEDATVYATLIFNQPVLVKEIIDLNIKNLHNIGRAKRKHPFKISQLSALAITGQFYRECLDEVERLKGIPYQLGYPLSKTFKEAQHGG